MTDRRPPHDLEAEESLLGAMLLAKDAIEAAADHLTPVDYYKPAHGHVHDAIVNLHARGEPADPVTVADHLRTVGHLDLVGGQKALIGFQAATPATGSAARYARIVADHALRRRLIAVGAELAQLGYEPPDDVGAAVDHAEQLVYNLDRPGQATTTRRLDTIMTAALERLVERAEKGETIDGIATGWVDLDNLLAGLPPGDVTIVGARPAMGKTEFACNLAWQVAQQRIPVVFASFEMTAEELAKRWLSNVAGVNRQSIRRADLDDDEWAAVNTSIASFVGVPIHVLDNFGASVSNVAAAARRVGVQGGLVIIDYAQLVAGARKAENRNVEVADISRALKLMAGQLGCHVMLLSQLSRSLETRGDKRPMLSDLRDSGALEQDASNVLFLYRDEVYKGEKSKARGVLEVICAKARNGPTGTVELFYRPHLGRIANIGFRTPPPQEDP